MAVYLHAIHFVLINNQNFPKAMDQLQKDLCGGGECEDHSLHENAPSPPKKKQFHIFFSLQKQFHLRALRNTIYFLKKNLIFTYIFRIPLGDLR